MTGWEYGLRTSIAYGNQWVGRIWEEKGPDGTTNWDRIQHFGEEGWELVTCFPIATGNGATIEVVWLFKRPRPAQ